MSEIAGGSLAEIASELVDIDTPLDVLPGTVTLIFRNNRVYDILAPGKYRRFGSKLPLVGGLKGMNLSTADIPLKVDVDSVVLNGEFPLEYATISLTIRIAAEDGFESLRAYVVEKGVNFVQLLDAALVAEVDGLLRDGLRKHSADRLESERKLIMATEFAGTSLLNGLFRIEEAVLGEPRFHEGYYRTREAAIGETVDDAEDQRKEKQAVKRGMSLEELENPDLRREREQREADMLLAASQHDADLRKALIEQLGVIGRRGGEQAMESVIRGVLGKDAASPAGDLPENVSFHKIPLAAGSRHQPHSDDDERLAGPPPELTALRSDPSLLRAWNTEGLPGRPLGISVTGRTAIVALRPRLDAEEAAQVSEALRRRCGATEVIIADGLSSIEDLVMGFLHHQAPTLAARVEDIQTAVLGTRFTITLFSSGERLQPLVSPLNDPQSEVLDPLAVLLPHEVIEVHAGSHG